MAQAAKGGGVAFGPTRAAAANPVPQEELARREEIRKKLMEVKFEPEFNASLGYSTRYMRDGWCRNDRPVGIGQIEMSEGIGYMGVIGVYDFSDAVGRKWRFQESRIYVGAAREYGNAGCLGPVTVDLNWTYNFYPGHSRENSGELSLSYHLNSIVHGKQWNLASVLTLTRDYDHKSTIISPEICWSWQMDEKGKYLLDTSAQLYWGNHGLNYHQTRRECDAHGFYSMVLRSGFRWQFAEKWTLVPEIALAFIPEDNIRHDGRKLSMVQGATCWATLKIQRQF